MQKHLPTPGCALFVARMPYLLCMEEGEKKLAVFTSVFPHTEEGGKERSDKFNDKFNLLMMPCPHRFWCTFKLNVLYPRIKAVILYHFNPV